MQLYLDVIRKMKKHKLGKELKKLEDDLIKTDYYINNCFFYENQAKEFINKINDDYKEELEYLDKIINDCVDEYDKDISYLLYDLSYRLFRVAIIRYLKNSPEEEIIKLVKSTDQNIYYEIMGLLNK